MRKYLSDDNNRAKHRARIERNKEKYKRQAKQAVSEFRKNGCMMCDETESCCLVAHHVDPTQKEFGIAQAVGGDIGHARLMSELDKCVCLCKNCHAKVHAEVISLPRKLIW